ncbi:MAG: DUF2752 domain-containing protein [Verrucomicrobiota bacterium]
MVGRHLPLALVPGLLLFASLIIPYQIVPIRICAMYRWTGVPCPFCGYSRSFAAITDGQWAWAWQNAPFAFVFYALTVIALFWNLAALLSGYCIARGSALRMTTPRRACFVILFFLAGILANWTYRLAMGLS